MDGMVFDSERWCLDGLLLYEGFEGSLPAEFIRTFETMLREKTDSLKFEGILDGKMLQH